MKLPVLLALSIFALTGTATADERLYVGAWKGAGTGQNGVYSSIRFLGGDQMEYCFKNDCYGWAIKGDPKKKVTFKGDSGRWVFKRLDEDTFDGVFTNSSGGVYKSKYVAK